MTDGRLRRWFLLAVGAVLVAVGAGGAQGAVRSPETTDATATTQPRQSGRLDALVAFAVERGPVGGVAVRRLAGGPTMLLRVPALAGATVRVESIVWDRSGERLAFSDSLGRVFVVDAAGSGLRAVARLAHGRVDDWSPDGRALAVHTVSSGCRRGKNPALYLVSLAAGRARPLPVYPGHTKNLAHLSPDDPASLGSVVFSPSGAELLYVWWQALAGECRTQTAEEVVATIRPDGTGRHPILRTPGTSAVWPIWSTSGRTLGLALGCLPGLFAWTGPDQSPLLIATRYDDCEVVAVNRKGRVLRQAWLEAGGRQTLYSIDSTGHDRVLRRLPTAHDQDYQMIGKLPGRGVIATLWPRAYLIPFDGSPLVPLPPLVAPSGWHLGELAAAGSQSRLRGPRKA